VASGRGAQSGILFRDATAIEALRAVDVLVVDKTGTLTQGRPVLTDLVALDGAEDDLLRLAAAVEAKSEHPLAQAILAAAAGKALVLPEAIGFAAKAGHGAEAMVEGRLVQVGAARLLAGVDLSALVPQAEALARQGRTPVYVAIDGRAAGLIAVADAVKPSARVAVAALRRLGLQVAMITGDAQSVADAIAADLGIAQVHAEVLPGGKVEVVRALGPGVAFVGDGINDAPALAAADVGIAVGTGTDVAIEAAEVVLIGGDPMAVATAVTLSRASMANIRQNLTWAFGYNAALIPVAAGFLVPFGGPQLSPVLAAAAMAMSSIFVLSNALRLRRLKAAS
jgi:Cu+-exporting ATPase